MRPLPDAGEGEATFQRNSDGEGVFANQPPHQSFWLESTLSPQGLICEDPLTHQNFVEKSPRPLPRRERAHQWSLRFSAMAPAVPASCALCRALGRELQPSVQTPTISFGTELAVLRIELAAGFRPFAGDWSESCARMGRHPSECTADKSPGDLGRQDWRSIGLANPRPIHVEFERGVAWLAFLNL